MPPIKVWYGVISASASSLRPYLLLACVRLCQGGLTMTTKTGLLLPCFTGLVHNKEKPSHGTIQSVSRRERVLILTTTSFLVPHLTHQCVSENTLHQICISLFSWSVSKLDIQIQKTSDGENYCDINRAEICILLYLTFLEECGISTNI